MIMSSYVDWHCVEMLSGRESVALSGCCCLFVCWLVGWLVGLFVSRRVIVIGFPCSQLANDYEAIQIAGKVERNRGILNDFFLLS